MNDALTAYIEKYTELELGMRALINRKGNSLCAQCSCICCDVVMCAEAIKSPFLKLVHQQMDEYDEQKGFITPTGCGLKKGRPSICYEYFCDNHFYAQPDDLHAEILKVIGALIFHATRNAKDDIALDDIQDAADLNFLNFELLEQQMQESMEALHIIQNFYQQESLSPELLTKLRRIRIAEEFQG